MPRLSAETAALAEFGTEDLLQLANTSGARIGALATARFFQPDRVTQALLEQTLRARAFVLWQQEGKTGTADIGSGSTESPPFLSIA